MQIQQEWTVRPETRGVLEENSYKTFCWNFWTPKLGPSLYLSVRMKLPSFMTGTLLMMLIFPNSSLYCCPETNTKRSWSRCVRMEITHLQFVCDVIQTGKDWMWCWSVGGVLICLETCLFPLFSAPNTSLLHSGYTDLRPATHHPLFALIQQFI